jgi:hypothetical protein
MTEAAVLIMARYAPVRVPRYRGLFQRVAKKLRVDPSYVSRVASGERHSKVVSLVLNEEIRHELRTLQKRRKFAKKKAIPSREPKFCKPICGRVPFDQLLRHIREDECEQCRLTAEYFIRESEIELFLRKSRN